jgi:hypothetical protein
MSVEKLSPSVLPKNAWLQVLFIFVVYGQNLLSITASHPSWQHQVARNTQ